MKTLIGWLMLTAGLAMFSACEDDPVDTGTLPLPLVFEDLTQKWHVLNNLESAYSMRRIDRYDQLLDGNFTFFLSAGDVGGGLPPSWDRAIEIQANTHLFSKTPPPPIPRCKSLRLDIDWEDDQGDPSLTWVEITQPGGTEKWYVTTVYYTFLIEVEPDMTYIPSPGSKAQFTVRNAGTDDAPQWRLVEMRDLAGYASFSTAGSSRATKATTWGQMKALYRG